MPESHTNIRRILLLVARVALAVVFLYAAYAKLKPQANMPWSAASVRTSLSLFAMGVDSYQLLSTRGVNFVAHWLPPFELFLGLWLLSGIALPVSSLVTTLLLAGFIAVQIRSFSLGQTISCGCFGPGEKIGPWSLLRDGLIILLSAAIFIAALRSRRSPGSPRVTTPSPAAS